MTIGSTIHDELVEVVCTPRAWAVTLDGQRLGRVGDVTTIVDRALALVPPHRRTADTFARFGEQGWAT